MEQHPKQLNITIDKKEYNWQKKDHENNFLNPTEEQMDNLTNEAETLEQANNKFKGKLKGLATALEFK